MTTKITILGTGRMGTALAGAYLARGYATTVWNRTAAKSAPLAQAGARIAPTVKDAVEGADVVIGNVSDYDASGMLLRQEGVASALRGKVFVELASGTPKQAKVAAAWAESNGVRYLDGAIMASPSFIGQPGCTLLYSGPRDLFDAQAPTLRVLGDNAIYAGADPGHASALDNALLITLWGSFHGLLQGAAICEAEDLTASVFPAALAGFFPAMDAALRDAADRIAKRRFAADEATQATVEGCHVSVQHVLAISKERGIDHGLPEALDRIFQRIVDAGGAMDDITAVYRAVRRTASSVA